MPMPNDPACFPCSLDTAPCSTDNTQWGYNHVEPKAPCNPNVYSTTPCSPNINAPYFPDDYLTPMAGKIMPMRKVFQDQFRGIADFFFDYDTAISDSTAKNTDVKLVFKNVANINLGQFYDGNYITRWEWYFKPTDFFVIQDVLAPSLTIPVGLVSGMGYTPTLGADYTTNGSGMLEVGDTVLIYRNDTSGSNPCCEQLIQKTIIAVDPISATITLESWFIGDPGFTFSQGDKIKKLFHARSDCDEITNTFWVIPNTAKRSYVQHFGYTISFKKCDLNKAYATPKGAADFVANRIYHANLELVRQMVFAAYRGRNRGDVCCSGSTTPAETQGLITGIIDANSRNPSLDLITSLQNVTTDEDKVRHILDVLLKVQGSGLVSEGAVVTMICNQKGLTALLKLNQAWNKFTGFTVMGSDNVNKNFVLPIIHTPNGLTEFKHCRILTELYPNEGVIIFVPKERVMLTARENAKFNYVDGSMVKATLGVTIEEVTPFKQHECRVFDVYTEAAIIWSGLDSGAFRMIMWLTC